MLWSVAVSRRPPNVMIGVRHAKYMKKNEARHCTCKESLKSLKYHGVLRRTSLRNPPNSLHNKTHSTSGEQYTYIITKSHQINNTINFSLNSKVCLTYWPLSSHSKLLWRYATVQSWIILKVALQSTPVHCLWYVRNVYRRISSNQNKRIIYRRPLQWMWLIRVLEATSTCQYEPASHLHAAPLLQPHVLMQTPPWLVPSDHLEASVDLASCASPVQATSTVHATLQTVTNTTLQHLRSAHTVTEYWYLASWQNAAQEI